MTNADNASVKKRANMTKAATMTHYHNQATLIYVPTVSLSSLRLTAKCPL